MLVSIINKQYIFNTFSSITTSIKNVITTDIITVISVFVGIALLAIGLTVMLTYSIANSLQKLSDASSAMAKRIGEESLTNGVNIEMGNTNITEVNEVVSHFKQTIANLAKQDDHTHENPYYQNVPWGYSMATAPPPQTVGDIYGVGESKGVYAT